MSTASEHRGMKTTTTNSRLAWILLAIAVVVNIAGYIFNLYSQFVWFDEVIHAYTTFAMTLAVALYAYGPVLTGAHKHTILFILMVTSIGLAIGGVWEVAEWVYDWLLIQKNTIKSVPDRLIDLIMDSVGGVVAGWMAVSMLEKQR